MLEAVERARTCDRTDGKALGLTPRSPLSPCLSSEVGRRPLIRGSSGRENVGGGGDHGVGAADAVFPLFCYIRKDIYMYTLVCSR